MFCSYFFSFWLSTKERLLQELYSELVYLSQDGEGTYEKEVCGMNNRRKKTSGILLSAALLFLTGCNASVQNTMQSDPSESESPVIAENASGSEESVRSAVNFDHELDSYVPLKDHYSFYFTYKTVHPWWDAVALGMEDAQRQYMEKGVVITYEYMAPKSASADDQRNRLLKAEEESFDVIGVDVADEKLISPLLDEMVERGDKVMTFSSSDAAEGLRMETSQANCLRKRQMKSLPSSFRRTHH